MSTCHHEVVDAEGMLDACNQPAVTERVDVDGGDFYPVCEEHRGGPGIEWSRGHARWLVRDDRGRITGRFRLRQFAVAALPTIERSSDD